LTVDGTGLPDLLKTLDTRMNEERVCRERLETRLTEAAATQERLEARLVEEQAAREALEQRVLKEQAAREHLETRLMEAMKSKADTTELLAVNAILPTKASVESIKGFQEQVDKLDASLKEVMEECKQKATAQQLQMMQRDLVVELWSMKGSGAPATWQPKSPVNNPA